MARRTRSELWGWIPAIVLAVVIIGVGTTTAVLLNGGLGAPVPRPTDGQVTDLNWSSFTPEGLDYIARSRQVRIDMSTQPVDAAAIGLDPNNTLVLEPIDNVDTVLDYDLIVNGGGAGAGGARFTVTQITIVTENGVITSLSAPLREVLNFRQTLNSLLARAELFGWDTSGVDAIYASAGDATRAGQPFEFTLGPADRAGVEFAATASCDPSGYCTVNYVVTPQVG
jgi:hypothetical protein